MFRSVSVSALALVLSAHASADYATQVVSYTAGSGVSAAFTDPTRALGEISRFTGGSFPGAITPFSPAYRSDQLVQVGRGGSLVVSFDRAITNDSSHLFGIDFIVFGNAFLHDASYPNGVANGTIAHEGGDIDVSADGLTWVRVATNAADGLFPTLGYSDLTNAYQTTAGAVLSDFHKPVDPNFQITAGMTFADIVAGYNGSGGGFGVDISATGLTEVRYVRISVAENAAFVPEIDGISVVPAPAAASLLALGLAASGRRRR